MLHGSPNAITREDTTIQTVQRVKDDEPKQDAMGCWRLLVAPDSQHQEHAKPANIKTILLQ